MSEEKVKYPKKDTDLWFNGFYARPNYINFSKFRFCIGRISEMLFELK